VNGFFIIPFSIFNLNVCNQLDINHLCHLVNGRIIAYDPLALAETAFTSKMVALTPHRTGWLFKHFGENLGFNDRSEVFSIPFS
jgi:hypothetical protein